MQWSSQYWYWGSHQASPIFVLPWYISGKVSYYVDLWLLSGTVDIHLCCMPLGLWLVIKTSQITFHFYLPSCRWCQSWPSPSLSPWCWWFCYWLRLPRVRQGTAKATGKCWGDHQATSQTDQETTPSTGTASGLSKVQWANRIQYNACLNGIPCTWQVICQSLIFLCAQMWTWSLCYFSPVIFLSQLPATVTALSWISPSWTQNVPMITCLCMMETPTRAPS